MNRRKFLAGSVAVGATTFAVNSNAGFLESNKHQLPASKSSSGKRGKYRLKYPLTKEEKVKGTVVYDLTFPTNDVRRYKPAPKLDGSVIRTDYM